MQKLICDKLAWVDLKSPSKKEIAALQKTYSIHPLVAEELAMPTYRPKVESYGDHLYLVLHTPVVKHGGKNGPPTESREVDFIIGKNYLVTVHYGNVPALGKLYGELVENKPRCVKSFGTNSGYILHEVIIRFFSSLLEELDQFTVGIDKIERRIFSKRHGYDEAVVEDISRLRHELLNFRRALKPQQGVLDSLNERGTLFFGAKMKPYFTDIIGEYLRVWHVLENHRETIDALNDTHISLLSTRSNEVMQRLTIMAFITFPLMLFASIFGMNTTWLPLMGYNYDFWVILGVMLFGTALMYLYFKKKHWL